MIDFNDALQQGLDAAKRAHINREQIKNVFVQINESLHKISGGKVEIAIVPAESTMDTIQRVAFAFDKNRREREYVLAVRLIGQESLQPKKIALWKQSDAGYPCSIIWGDRHASCDDVDSLKNELAELLRSPSVGEAIFKAMGSDLPVSSE